MLLTPLYGPLRLGVDMSAAGRRDHPGVSYLGIEHGRGGRLGDAAPYHRVWSGYVLMLF